MQLGWLHDHRQSDRPGGAQLSSEAMAQAAPEWAEVLMCYPGEMHEADAYVLNNVKLFSYSALLYATERPYVKYEHDHWNCAQPWQQGWIRPIINNAEAVVFLSPMHRDNFCELHKVTPRRAFVVPSPVDPSLWDEHMAKWGTVWMGTFCWQKGVEGASAWAAENGPVRFYGSGPLTPSGPNVEVRGQIPYSDVPRILATAKRFLFLPACPEPFGRVVAEAAMSGCELVCNNNVGALSWGWKTLLDWQQGTGSAPTAFWEIMGEVLGCG